LFDETVALKGSTQMTQIQSNTNQTAHSTVPIDPTPLIQSESPTAVILAISILIFILLGSIAELIQVIQKVIFGACCGFAQARRLAGSLKIYCWFGMQPKQKNGADSWCEAIALIGFHFNQQPIIQPLQVKDFHGDRQPSSEIQMTASPRDRVRYQPPFLLASMRYVGSAISRLAL
jgi:hypothetical protein